MRPLLVISLPIFAMIFCGCAAQYSSVNREEAAAEIIVGSSGDLLAALSETVEENFIVDYDNQNPGAGRLFFRGYGTDTPLRGEVSVTIVLKQVSGLTASGEEITGYSLNMTSKGSGPNASMFPSYATNNIYNALMTKLGDHNLSLAHARNLKVERFTPTDTEAEAQ